MTVSKAGDKVGSMKDEQSVMVIYAAEDGMVHVEVRLEDGNMWASQSAMAGLFGVQRPAITRHLRNIFQSGELEEPAVCSIMEHTAADGKRYATKFYNLDAIISVGYRVNSLQATRFRIWATKVLREYLEKGYLLDEERMKSGKNMAYFDELQARIREIRLSERIFYQKIKDIYATSIDYDAKSDLTIRFFKVVQNKLLWAISQKTAAELVYHRANGNLPFMGMTSYSANNERRITQQDAVTAKNYLSENEMEDLGLLVEQYLAFAEAQARRGIAMTMQDWIARLDAILTLNGRELLKHAGQISHEMASECSRAQLEILRGRLREKEHMESLIELEQDLFHYQGLPSPNR